MNMNGQMLGHSLATLSNKLGVGNFTVYYPQDFVVGSEREACSNAFFSIGAKNKKVSFSFFGDNVVTSAICRIEKLNNVKAMASRVSSFLLIKNAEGFLLDYCRQAESKRLRLTRIYLSNDGFLLNFGRESKSKVHFVDLLLLFSKEPKLQYIFNAYFIDVPQKGAK